MSPLRASSIPLRSRSISGLQRPISRAAARFSAKLAESHPDCHSYQVLYADWVASLRCIADGECRLVAALSSRRVCKDVRDRDRRIEMLRVRLASSASPASHCNKSNARFLDFTGGLATLNEDKIAAAAALGCGEADPRDLVVQ